MSSNNSSNKVALLALLSLIPIFIFVIGNGWASILAPVVHLGGAPTTDQLAAYIAGGLFGLVAVILAWAVASERSRLQTDKTDKYAWLAYLVFLFALSALGTMNWLFKVSEIPTFIKESAVTTEKGLKSLDDLALNGITLAKTEQLLRDQEEEKNELTGLVIRLKGELAAVDSAGQTQRQAAQAKIINLVDAFENEVSNPLRAGCGEVAHSYIDQIQAILGDDLHLPSGNCKEAKPEVVVKSYKDSIQKAMDRHFGNAGIVCANTSTVKDISSQIEAIIKVPATALDNGCPTTETVASDTEAAVERYLAALPRTAPEERGLADLGSRSSQELRAEIKKVNDIYLDTANLQKDIAAPVLKEAWSVYRRVYSDLSSAVDPNKLSTLPESIDDQRIDKIGDLANTIEILISRYDHISTYPIVFAGILFDMILITFFFRVISSRRQPKAKTGHRGRLEDIFESFADSGNEKP